MKTNKWKLALLVWSAMFPFSTAISYGLARLPFIVHWPLVARTFCLTGLLVPFMVFGALPFLNRRFQRWLQMPAPDADVRPTPTTAPTAAQSVDDPVEQTRVDAYTTYPRLTTNGVET